MWAGTRYCGCLHMCVWVMRRWVSYVWRHDVDIHAFPKLFFLLLSYSYWAWDTWIGLDWKTKKLQRCTCLLRSQCWGYRDFLSVLTFLCETKNKAQVPFFLWRHCTDLTISRVSNPRKRSSNIHFAGHLVKTSHCTYSFKIIGKYF